MADRTVGSGGGTQRMAYFADWNTANRGYTIKDVDDSGAAERLDRILWAFGDVSSEGLCHIPEDANQPWEIYQRRYDAADSVDGEADTYRQPLAGSLNQLRELQDKYPDLAASISLGGWNWSRYFSDAAATEESRERFAASCVDLWLRGDLPRFEGEPQGGDGVAEGIFDGIDLDWEWPGGSGHPDNVERPEDGRNFTLLVQEFRRQLDALGEETGEEYTLSASLSHDEEIMRDGYEPEIFDSLDFATVQGYDFAGSWSETTDHHSQLYAPEGASDDTSADLAVRTYLDHGLPADKLVLGFPGYGRGWRGVQPTGFGRYAQAQGAAEGDYGEGTDAYAVLEERDGQRFFDPVNGAYWIYDGDEWWTYDTPEIVAMKGDYVLDKGLRGLVLWNLDMDPRGELVAAMDESLAG
ncbi:glycoside hydrolase family 18 protein [Spinactinospora alkalitolerans]|nr:glycoside hydrolase family 18 protein [Spinactinospora alkalitolerans]